MHTLPSTHGLSRAEAWQCLGAFAAATKPRHILQKVEDAEDAQMAATASLELQQTECLLKAVCYVFTPCLAKHSSVQSASCGLIAQCFCNGLPLRACFHADSHFHIHADACGYDLAQGDFQSQQPVAEKAEKLDWCAPESEEARSWQLIGILSLEA